MLCFETFTADWVDEMSVMVLCSAVQQRAVSTCFSMADSREGTVQWADVHMGAEWEFSPINTMCFSTIIVLMILEKCLSYSLTISELLWANSKRIYFPFKSILGLLV